MTTGESAREGAPDGDQERGLRISRRQVVIGGAAVVGLAATGRAASMVIDDGFEKHVASVLGISRDLARAYTARARAGLGGAQYEFQAAQFAAATTFPGTALPDSLRENAVRELLESMLRGVPQNAAYAGLVPAGELGSPCTGLGPV